MEQEKNKKMVFRKMAIEAGFSENFIQQVFVYEKMDKEWQKNYIDRLAQQVKDIVDLADKIDKLI